MREMLHLLKHPTVPVSMKAANGQSFGNKLVYVIQRKERKRLLYQSPFSPSGEQLEVTWIGGMFVYEWGKQQRAIDFDEQSRNAMAN